jgi:protein-glucosylgalactosylhydroxylysine glucosidase
MGPDEDTFNVTNNVYTNVNAAYNLLFGGFAGCSCKDILNVSEEQYKNFENIATNLKILYDEKQDLHPQYEGFAGQKIKQADVVLLGYPLQFPMKALAKHT